MSSTLLKQADKLTLGLVGAACIAALGDAYVKRVKTVDDGQKIVDAMYTEKQRVETEKPRSSSVHDDQVNSARACCMLPAHMFPVQKKMLCTQSCLPRVFLN